MLNRNYLNVPIGIKYISDWKELDLPKGHYILNKIVTGCGFTEYFLNNNIPTILCSPRKALLGNKHRQHKTEGRPTYLYKNKYDTENNVDSSANEKARDEKKIEDPQDILQYNNDLKSYIESNYNIFNDIIPKILVTYDSLWHVLEVINNISPTLLNQFQVVVDEFQSIFSDSAFKADTEVSFVDYLQNVPNVCYLSATPVLDKYLEQLDEFKNLPYYELVWDKSMITKPVINRKKVKSIPEACYNIIQEYKNGIYPRKYYNNQIIESKEVVFYINSVTDICKIIKKAELKEDEVNVICAEDSKNLKKLKAVGISKYGTVPLKGEAHKMFTFCTRTVYLGTDFYSTNATTVICSDSNLDCMVLDISLDLPQIMGRQRLEENVFRHEAIFFYKSTIKECSFEDFQKSLSNKVNRTRVLLGEYNNMSELGKREYNLNLKITVMTLKYKNDFVGISNKTGLAVYNKLVELSYCRAWEIQQLNYKDEVAVINSIEENFQQQNYINEGDQLIQEFIFRFNELTLFREKMKLYCDFLDAQPSLLSVLIRRSEIPNQFLMYYEILGTKFIRSKSYDEYLLKTEIDNKLKNPETKDALLFFFQPGNKFTKKVAKEKLQEIYNQLGLIRKAKSTDLEEYFEVRRIKIKNQGSGKYDEGIEIISLK